MSKKSKISIIVSLSILACIVIASVIVFVSQNAAGTASVIPDETMSSMVSDLLADISVNTNVSSGGEDSAAAFTITLKYPFTVNNEGLELTVDQLQENIADLQSQYLAYLKTCKSEDLAAAAQETYDQKLITLKSLIQIKERTPEEQNAIHETAFYESYNSIKEKYDHPEKYGFTSEYIAERMEVAERAKNYYEAGVITIEQACQAIGLSSPSLEYDETFSLPD